MGVCDGTDCSCEFGHLEIAPRRATILTCCPSETIKNESRLRKTVFDVILGGRDLRGWFAKQHLILEL